MAEKLPESHVLMELQIFESAGRPMSDLVRDHFGNMVSMYPDHPDVVAFANKHGLMEHLSSQPAA